MKKETKNTLKNTLIFIGLVALSVLYLFEVNFSSLSWLNGVAFVIIALTLIPLLIRIIMGIVKKVKEMDETAEEKDQE